MGIQFETVSYHYAGHTNVVYEAIREITLSIEAKGEFIAIVGHTGSGKSTLVQHMNALIFPTSGSVDIFGSKVTAKRDKHIRYNDLRRRVGLVFQFPEYQLFEETVEKDIMFGPLNFKVDPETAKAKAKECIQLVGLDEKYLTRNPFNLSGGEKKRVSIAGILAIDPEILVLDEPTSGLDPVGRKAMMELFKDIQAKTGKSIIVITHDMDLVYRYASRVLVLKEGRLLFDGGPDALFKRADLADFKLEDPGIVAVMRKIRDTLGYDIDIYQRNLDDAVAELIKGMAK